MKIAGACRCGSSDGRLVTFDLGRPEARPWPTMRLYCVIT